MDRLSSIGKTRLLYATCIATAVSIVLFTRWRAKVEEKRRIRRKTKSSINIGGIFGMDVGGTLAKIVYFEADLTGSESRANGNQSKVDSNTQDSNNNSNSNNPNASSDRVLKRTTSFPTMDTPDHHQALNQLYTIMNNEGKDGMRDDYLQFYSRLLGGKLHFLNFETRNMEKAIAYIGSKGITDHIQTIGCTGGGGHKYAKEFEDHLGIKVLQMDELGCLIKGMDFAFTSVDGECYTYRFVSEEVSSKDVNNSANSISNADNSNIDNSNNNSNSSNNDNSNSDSNNSGDNNNSNSNTTTSANSSPSPSKKWSRDSKEYNLKVDLPREMFTSKTIYPYLVVNIGSGVSILKVTAPGHFERVSGSSVGGGTYWGLCRLLTGCNSFEEVLDLAESGDASEIDMLVKDIYGGSYDSMNLNGSMVASSFGKLVMKDNPRDGVKEEDLALALLMMITNNIGQVSYLNAQLHGCSKIFFVGSFLRHNSISCRRLSYAIDFWSKGKMEALFLKHEGYFGALGTFLQSAFGDEIDNILSLGHRSRGGLQVRPGRSVSTESSGLDVSSPSLGDALISGDSVGNIGVDGVMNHDVSIGRTSSDPNSGDHTLVSRVLLWSKRGLSSYRKSMIRYRKKWLNWRDQRTSDESSNSHMSLRSVSSSSNLREFEDNMMRKKNLDSGNSNHQISGFNNNSDNHNNITNYYPLSNNSTKDNVNNGASFLSNIRNLGNDSVSTPLSTPRVTNNGNNNNIINNINNNIDNNNNVKDSVSGSSYTNTYTTAATNSSTTSTSTCNSPMSMYRGVSEDSHTMEDNLLSDQDDDQLKSSTSLIYETGAGSEDETSPLNDRFVRRRVAMGLEGSMPSSYSRAGRRAFSQDSDDIIDFLPRYYKARDEQQLQLNQQNQQNQVDK